MARKSLDNLVRNSYGSGNKNKSLDTNKEATGAELIPYERIVKNPLNTDNEKSDEIIQSLMISIDLLGLLEPLIVYKDDDNFYKLIAGEGRYTAIGKLRESKHVFDKVLCIVRPKPKNEEEEKLLILTSNEQRNTPSIERTDRNLKEMCRLIKDLADQGQGEFSELLKGMKILQRTAIYNYNKVYMELDEPWLQLFNEDKLTMQNALFLSKYTIPEQQILFGKYNEDADSFAFTKENAKQIISPYEGSEEKQILEEVYDELKKTKEEKLKLEKALKKEREKDTSELSRTRRKNKEQKEEDIKGKLKEKEDQIKLLKEQLERSQQMKPVFSDRELEEAKNNDLLILSLEGLSKQLGKVKKEVEKHQRKYGNVSDEVKALLDEMKKMI